MSPSTPSRTVNNLLTLLTPDKVTNDDSHQRISQPPMAPFSPVRGYASNTPRRIRTPTKRCNWGTPTKPSRMTEPMLNRTPVFNDVELKLRTQTIKRPKLNEREVPTQTYDPPKSIPFDPIETKKELSSKQCIGALLDAWTRVSSDQNNRWAETVTSSLFQLRNTEDDSLAQFVTLLLQVTDRIRDRFWRPTGRVPTPSRRSPHATTMSEMTPGSTLILLPPFISYLIWSLGHIFICRDYKNNTELVHEAMKKLISVIIEFTNLMLSIPTGDRSMTTSHYTRSLLIHQLMASEYDCRSEALVMFSTLTVKYLVRTKLIRTAQDDMLPYTNALLTQLSKAANESGHKGAEYQDLVLQVIYELLKGWYEEYSIAPLTAKEMLPTLEMIRQASHNLGILFKDSVPSLLRLMKVVTWFLKQVPKCVPHSTVTTTMEDAKDKLSSPNIRQLIMTAMNLVSITVENATDEFRTVSQETALYTTGAYIYASMLGSFREMRPNRLDFRKDLSAMLTALLSTCLPDGCSEDAMVSLRLLVDQYDADDNDENEFHHTTIESILQIVQISRHCSSIAREHISTIETTEASHVSTLADELLQFSKSIIGSLLYLRWDPSDCYPHLLGHPKRSIPALTLGTPKKYFNNQDAPPAAQTPARSRCTTPLHATPVRVRQSPHSAPTKSPARFLTPRLRAMSRSTLRRGASIHNDSNKQPIDGSEEPFHLTYAFGVISEINLWRKCHSVTTLTIHSDLSLLEKAHPIVTSWLRGMLEGLLWALTTSGCDCPNSSVISSLLETESKEDSCQHILGQNLLGKEVFIQAHREDFVALYRSYFQSRCLRLFVSILDQDNDELPCLEHLQSCHSQTGSLQLVYQAMYLWRRRKRARTNSPLSEKLPDYFSCPPLITVSTNEAVKSIWNDSLRPIILNEDDEDLWRRAHHDITDVVMLPENDAQGRNFAIGIYLAIAMRRTKGKLAMELLETQGVDLSRFLPIYCLSIDWENRADARARARRIDELVLGHLSDLDAHNCIALLMAPMMTRYDDRSLEAITNLSQAGLFRTMTRALEKLVGYTLECIDHTFNIAELRQWVGSKVLSAGLALGTISPLKNVLKYFSEKPIALDEEVTSKGAELLLSWGDSRSWRCLYDMAGENTGYFGTLLDSTSWEICSGVDRWKVDWRLGGSCIIGLVAGIVTVRHPVTNTMIERQRLFKCFLLPTKDGLSVTLSSNDDPAGEYKLYLMTEGEMTPERLAIGMESLVNDPTIKRLFCINVDGLKGLFNNYKHVTEDALHLCLSAGGDEAMFPTHVLALIRLAESVLKQARSENVPRYNASSASLFESALTLICYLIDILGQKRHSLISKDLKVFSVVDVLLSDKRYGLLRLRERLMDSQPPGPTLRHALLQEEHPLIQSSLSLDHEISEALHPHSLLSITTDHPSHTMIDIIGLGWVDSLYGLLITVVHEGTRKPLSFHPSILPGEGKTKTKRNPTFDHIEAILTLYEENALHCSDGSSHAELSSSKPMSRPSTAKQWWTKRNTLEESFRTSFSALVDGLSSSLAGHVPMSHRILRVSENLFNLPWEMLIDAMDHQAIQQWIVSGKNEISPQMKSTILSCAPTVRVFEWHGSLTDLSRRLKIDWSSLPLKYIIDPDGDIPSAIKAISKEWTEHPKRAGIIGQQQSSEEVGHAILNAMTRGEGLLYAGHNAGEQYFHNQALGGYIKVLPAESNEKNKLSWAHKSPPVPNLTQHSPLVLLFGCRGAGYQRLRARSELYESTTVDKLDGEIDINIAMHFLLAGSQVVVGMLEDCTDKDLDRIMKRFIRCTEESNSAIKNDIARLVMFSKYHCQYPLLTGASLITVIHHHNPTD